MVGVGVGWRVVWSAWCLARHRQRAKACCFVLCALLPSCMEARRWSSKHDTPTKSHHTNQTPQQANTTPATNSHTNNHTNQECGTGFGVGLALGWCVAFGLVCGVGLVLGWCRVGLVSCWVGVGFGWCGCLVGVVRWVGVLGWCCSCVDVVLGWCWLVGLRGACQPGSPRGLPHSHADQPTTPSNTTMNTCRVSEWVVVLVGALPAWCQTPRQPTPQQPNTPPHQPHTNQTAPCGKGEPLPAPAEPHGHGKCTPVSGPLRGNPGSLSVPADARGYGK